MESRGRSGERQGKMESRQRPQWPNSHGGGGLRAGGEDAESERASRSGKTRRPLVEGVDEESAEAQLPPTPERSLPLLRGDEVAARKGAERTPVPLTRSGRSRPRRAGALDAAAGDGHHTSNSVGVKSVKQGIRASSADNVSDGASRPGMSWSGWEGGEAPEAPPDSRTSVRAAREQEGSTERCESGQVDAGEVEGQCWVDAGWP